MCLYTCAMPGDRCMICKHARLNIIARYARIRFCIDYRLDVIRGKCTGICVGFSYCGGDSGFFDVAFIKKKHVRYLGIPLQEASYGTLLRENSTWASTSHTQSALIHPIFFDPYSNCALDFVSKLPVDPGVLIFANKISVKIERKLRYCVNDDVPTVAQLGRVVRPPKPFQSDTRRSDIAKILYARY